MKINLCVLGGPLAPVYKRAKGEGRPAWFGRAKGSPTPTGSRIPPFLVQLGEGGKGGEWRRKGEGAAPPNPLSNSDWAWEGRAPPPGSFPLRPSKAQYSSPYSRNSPVPPKIPEPLRTLPMSEYSRPIYRSLRLDHFETPRHVPDLIRDSELLRYIKTHNITVIETLSVRTLRFENNVDMTETRLRSITNSRTWMPILVPTYSTKIFIGQTA